MRSRRELSRLVIKRNGSLWRKFLKTVANTPIFQTLMRWKRISQISVPSSRRSVQPCSPKRVTSCPTASSRFSWSSRTQSARWRTRWKKRWASLMLQPTTRLSKSSRSTFSPLAVRSGSTRLSSPSTAKTLKSPQKRKIRSQGRIRRTKSPKKSNKRRKRKMTMKTRRKQRPKRL